MANPMDRLNNAYDQQDALDLDMPVASDETIDELAGKIAGWLKKRRNVKRIIIHAVPGALRDIASATAKIIILGG